MKNYIPASLTLLVLCLIAILSMPGTVAGVEKHILKFVEEWDKEPPSEVQTRPPDKEKLLADLDKAAAAQAAISSWEARYHHESRSQSGAVSAYAARIAADGKRWLYERYEGSGEAVKIENRVICNGETVWMISPNQKNVMIQTLDHLAHNTPNGVKGPELPLGFMPLAGIYGFNYLLENLPDFRQFLRDPNTKTLPCARALTTILALSSSE